MFGKWKREYNRQVELNLDLSKRVIDLENWNVGLGKDLQKLNRQLEDAKRDNNALNSQVKNMREEIDELEATAELRTSDVDETNRVLQKYAKDQLSVIEDQKQTIDDVTGLVAMLTDILKGDE